MELDFRIFTLNCWGIPMISKDLKERFEAIGDFLFESDYDCVCLQEVWSQKQYEYLKSHISKNFPHSHYFFSGYLGSGICMFSKHPIVDVYFHQWQVNGYIHKIQHADWFGGKGVGLCRIKLNEYLINVYTAHLHAEYDREHDIYKGHRIIQAFDTAQFIRFTSGCGDLVVLAGDLNSEPGDLAHRLLLTLPDLSDSLNAEEKKYATYETPANSYTPGSLKRSNEPGKRIDYILYHPGSTLRVYLKNHSLPLPSRVPNKSFSYSDHEAVSAVLHLNGDKAEWSSENFNEKLSTLEESVQVLEKELARLKSHKIFYLTVGIIMFCLFLITIFVDVPYEYGVPYNVLRGLLAIFTIILVGMGSIWNSIENSAVISNLLSMKILIDELSLAKDSRT